MTIEDQPPTLGEILCARRRELDLSLSEVAKSTRISRAYLKALEEDRPEGFPAETYRIGFLRTYAGVLGLKMCDLPARTVLPPTESLLLAAAVPPRSSGKRILAVMAVAVLVAAAIISASVYHVSKEPPAVAAEPMASEEIPSQEEVFPLSEESNAGAIGVVEPSSVSLPLAEEATSPGSPAEFPASRVVSTETPSPPAADSGSLPQNDQKPPAPEVVANVIRLRALGPSRLELVLDNRPPQNYELKTETELSWRLRRSALVRVDNPSQVELWFGDELLDMAGKSQIFIEARPESGGERP